MIVITKQTKSPIIENFTPEIIGRKALKMANILERVTGAIQRQGTATEINGHVLQAVWAKAQPGRIQMFLQELMQGRPAYDVALPASALNAPYLARAGTELIWQATGWRGVIRSLDPIEVGGTVVAVSVVVEIV